MKEIQFSASFTPQQQKCIQKHLKPLSAAEHSDVSEDITKLHGILHRDIPAGDITQNAATLFTLRRYGLMETAILKENFSETLVSVCMGGEKITRLESGTMDYQLESFIKLILNIAEDPRSILIVLAQQLRIMRHFKTTPPQSPQNQLKWVINVFAPIAHRLGLYNVKTELEELWLKHDDYTTYRRIADKLESKKDEREEFIQKFISPIKAAMNDSGIQCEIKGRSKSIFSIWKKMQNQGVDVDGIYDKFAIRIIIQDVPRDAEKDMCWRVYSLVTEKYRPFPKRLRDWISHPKASGYESLHTTVSTSDNQWVEIQIRTERMDHIAEKGHAAHWKYKGADSKETSGSTDYLARMREALETPEIFDTTSHSLKKAFYSREIYVFTPGDELIRLRPRATVLDFAFAIHTDIGFRCTGALVNNTHVSLRAPLKTGDVVQVLTSRDKHPNREWLSIVQSPSAAARIRRYLKEQNHSRLDEGREMVRRKLRSLDTPMSDAHLKILCDYFNCPSVLDLYSGAGEGKLDLQPIGKDLFSPAAAPSSPKAPKKRKKASHHHSENCLQIGNEIDNVQYTLAKCCSPARGDDIFGFITVNKGVSIHRKTCPNAQDLYQNHPDRIITAAWKKESESRFNKSIRVYSACEADELLSKISRTIKLSPRVRLVKIHMNTSAHLREHSLEITLEVSHTDDFQRFIETVQSLSIVDSLLYN
ncbi:MAG: RelA/SpoT family protein [Fibrobacterota bacterium]